MGNESALNRDLEQAIHHWRKAFRQDPGVQRMMIESLAGQLPVELFLSSFDPDTTGLRILYEQDRKHGVDEPARQVAIRLVSQLEQDVRLMQPPQAARVWHESQSIYTWLREPELALQCQHLAVELAPHDFELRKSLAMLLTAALRYGDAIPHFEWCLRRRPDDQQLREQLAEVRLRDNQLPRSGRTASRAKASRNN
jgi:hypothetical protein